MQSTNPLSAVATDPGCTNTSASLANVVSTGADGIPAGIVTDAVVVTGTCAGSSDSASITAGASISAGSKPLSWTYCPGMTSCTYTSATDGYIALGTYTYEGSDNYMAGAYFYNGSGTETVYARLGTVLTGCTTGSLVADSGIYNIENGEYVEVIWGPNSGSATWNSSAWGNSNGSSTYGKLGIVCGLY
jgi:hypothetical protein